MLACLVCCNTDSTIVSLSVRGVAAPCDVVSCQSTYAFYSQQVLTQMHTYIFMYLDSGGTESERERNASCSLLSVVAHRDTVLVNILASVTYCMLCMSFPHGPTRERASDTVVRLHVFVCLFFYYISDFMLCPVWNRSVRTRSLVSRRPRTGYLQRSSRKSREERWS